jgi:hypothetical protein
MTTQLIRPCPATCPPSRRRTAHPHLEYLENRLLLYSTLGAQWAYGSRITYSFVPDGTSVGGTPSALFQSLNAKFPTATWQQQFQKAAAVWQAVANINLAQVPDDGSPIGVNGNQQDDPRFGDIRCSAIPQSSGTLAVCFLPPPINGGSDAGDIVFNSNVGWQINSSYDIETVAIHEIGHALGMGHSQITTACMYAYYSGLKQTLTSDDISGIQSIYGVPQYDRCNANGQSNGTSTTAVNLSPFIDANGQLAAGGLDITTGSQAEWFYVTVPSSTTGTMVATVQSTGLSSLNPKVTVYSSSLKPLGMVGSSNYGDTVSFSVGGVVPGQGFYIRASNNGGSSNGAFGLELNFGSLTQPPILPPKTVVPQQPDRGGGTAAQSTRLDRPGGPWGTTSQLTTLFGLNGLMGWGDALTTADDGPRQAYSPQDQAVAQPGSATVLDAGGLEDAGPPVSNQPLTPASAAWAGTRDAGVSGRSELVTAQALDEVLDSWESAGVRSLFEA